MLLTIKSNAAMAIKPGITTWTNINVSDSYSQCYNLRNADSTLGSNQLDPHLTLNKDWGAVAYLAISSYGAVTDSTGPQIWINSLGYYSTTGNATGVIDMGHCYTQTSSLKSDYESGNNYITTLINNVNSKYVEKFSSGISSTDTLGQAINETKAWWSSTFHDSGNGGYPVVNRGAMLGIDLGLNLGNGKGASDVTFRPVIWNIK